MADAAGVAASVKVSHLTCERGFHVVLNDVSFQLIGGEMLVLEGANGSGKTTLLKCMAGLLRDYSGKITNSLSQVPLYIGHQCGMSDGLSALQNLGWYRALRGMAANDDLVHNALASMGISHLAEQVCGELSAGQRRRVALTRLLLEPSSCWLLDEPAASLDNESLQHLVGLCEQQVDGGGIVCLSTHQRLPLGNDVRRLHLQAGCVFEPTVDNV